MVNIPILKIWIQDTPFPNNLSLGYLYLSYIIIKLYDFKANTSN